MSKEEEAAQAADQSDPAVAAAEAHRLIDQIEENDKAVKAAIAEISKRIAREVN